MRKRERGWREGKSFLLSSAFASARPCHLCTHPNRVIHLRHVTGERARYADAFKDDDWRGNLDFCAEVESGNGIGNLAAREVEKDSNFCNGIKIEVDSH